MFGSNYNDYRIKLGYNPKLSTEAEWTFYKTATWTKQFAWLPHRCNLTKEYIWLENAYKGTAIYRVDDNHFISEHTWHNYDEHIIWELQR